MSGMTKVNGAARKFNIYHYKVYDLSIKLIIIYLSIKLMALFLLSVGLISFATPTAGGITPKTLIPGKTAPTPSFAGTAKVNENIY